MKSEAPLNLLVGRVVRHGAVLERLMRRLWLMLASPSLAVHVPPDSMTVYIDQVRRMVKHAQLSDEKVAICFGTMDAVGLAWKERNRVVHDIWVEEPEAESEFVRKQLPRRRLGIQSRTVVTADDLQVLVSDLHRVVARLEYLLLALRNELPSWQQGPPRSIFQGDTSNDWEHAGGGGLENIGYMTLRMSGIRPDGSTFEVETSDPDDWPGS